MGSFRSPTATGSPSVFGWPRRTASKLHRPLRAAVRATRGRPWNREGPHRDHHLAEKAQELGTKAQGRLRGPADEGARVLQPLREFGTPLADLSGEMPFRIVNSTFDAFFPKGEVASYWKSVYMDDLTDDAIDFIVKIGTDRSSPMTLIHVPLLGGAMSRVSATDTAFGDRSAGYMLSVDGNWTDRSENAEHTTWVRDVIADAQRFGNGGTYLNFDAPDEQEEASFVQAAFGTNVERLRALKQKYDPENLFRLNNNIAP